MKSLQQYINESNTAFSKTNFYKLIKQIVQGVTEKGLYLDVNYIGETEKYEEYGISDYSILALYDKLKKEKCHYFDCMVCSKEKGALNKSVRFQEGKLYINK